MKLKIFCLAKETINKIKRQPIEQVCKDWAECINRHFFREDIQMAKIHEKMLNIIPYQRNAKQNYNEVSSHTDQNGHHQKVYKQ